MNHWKHVTTSLSLAVFIGIILMKPVHLLLLDHSHCDDPAHSEKQDSRSHDNCTICQFTFDVSSPAVFSSAQIVYSHLISEIKSVEKVVFISLAVVHSTPRAPPAHSFILSFVL
ncbi:MAG: hypothetical protein H6Q14_2688 [Bacteroidetes bacterium]|jgi:hypothetical protein|nr:hypothetical protein [Bacteroidota bacterium]